MPATITGRKCYTNGTINLFIKDTIPEGFVPGRTLTTKTKESYKNRKRNTNSKPSPISLKRKADYQKMKLLRDEYTNNYLSHGREWCHDYYNISYGLINELNKEFNIHQLAVEQGNEKRHQTWKNKRDLSDEELKNKIKNGYFDKSHFEEEITKYLKCNYELNNRLLLEGKEVDIYIPDYNLAIEFNGSYWHSDLHKDRKYHQNKSIQAEKKGIRLIHIYEYEWENNLVKDKIISLLNIATQNLKSKIYARDCEIKEITNQEAKLFNDKNHLQNHRNAQITYGLYYKDKLVQLMSFSKTKYNRNLKNNNSWEIIRGCPASNNIVVGGVSKLFKHFIKKQDPDEIFSYCDFNKFNGVGYESLGMEFIGYTEPDLKYVLDNDEVVNRNPQKYKYNKEHCKYKIYGSGSKKYLWKKFS